MRVLFRLCGWLILFSLCSVGSALAAPGLVNYQGTLVDSSGLPVTNAVQVEFALFATDVSGEALWSELHSVTPQNGAYAVLLGSVTPFPADLFQNDERWLQLTVGGETLLPRQRLASVPYAVSARSAGCNPGDFVLCFGGDPQTLDVGLCRAGKRFCLPDGSGFGDCVGTVLPATESCDSKDNDCNGVVDDAANAPTWYRDSDDDGFGDLQNAKGSCAQPDGFIASAGDCLDSDATVKPGAQEFCDGLDNDCDGQVDDSCLRPPACSASDKAIVIDCSAQYNYNLTGVLNCINSYGTVPQGCLDAALGLYNCGQGVCGYLNVSNENCYAQECSGPYQTAFVGRPPLCPSGASRPCGMNVGACQSGTESCINGDWSGVCEGSVEPQPEICGNGLDDDCDGNVDALPVPVCPDADQDGFPSGQGCTSACNAPAEFVPQQGLPDCNDTDASVNPWAFEQCDGIDNDCSGTADDNLFNAPSNPNQQGVCASSTQACVGAQWVASYGQVFRYEATEVTCDNTDNDCDGEVDEACTVTDVDYDGYSAAVDCNDNDSSINPGATEECDGRDNDCDGATDEALTPPAGWVMYGVCAGVPPVCNGVNGWYPDYASMTGYESSEVTCDGLDNDCNGQVDEICLTGDEDSDGYSLPEDCNDSDPMMNPGLPELCGDGKDNNCDGQTDEQPCQTP